MGDMITINKVSITIKNQWMPTRFYMFQDAPVPENVPSGSVYSNVFQVTPKVQSKPDGTMVANFETQNSYYAIYGTTSGGTGKVKVTTASSRAVKLGPKGSVICLTTDSRAPKWDTPSEKGKVSDAQYGFDYVADSTLGNVENDTYIGIGVQDPKRDGTVVPIQTYQAIPSLTSRIYPKLTYYIATGEYEAGQLVDRSKIGKYVKIDFMGSKKQDARLIIDVSGNWQDDNGYMEKNDIKWESS